MNRYSSMWIIAVGVLIAAIRNIASIKPVTTLTRPMTDSEGENELDITPAPTPAPADLIWRGPNGREIKETKGRVYVELQEVNRLRLYITDLQSSDSGNFTCETTLKTKDRRRLKAHNNIQLFEEIKFNESPTSVVHKSGESPLIECTATGNPAPEVSWRFGGRKLNSDGVKYRYETKGLRILSLGPDDAGPYDCRATVTSQGNVRLRRIDVIVLYPPEFLSPITTDVTPVQGQDFTLQCQGRGFPSIRYEWFKETNSEQMAADEPMADESSDETNEIEANSSSSNYKTKIVQKTTNTDDDDEDDDDDDDDEEEGNFDAMEEKLEKLMTTTRSRPTTALPYTTVTRGIGMGRVTEGVVTGKVTGGVASGSVMEQTNRTRLSGDVGDVTGEGEIEGEGSQGRHVITAAQRSDEGRYVCRISNDLGSTESFVDIELLIPPKIAPFPSTNQVTSLEGRSIEMTCETTEGRPRSQITWYRRTNDMLSSDNPILISSSESDDNEILDFSNEEENDGVVGRRLTVDSSEPGVSRLIIHAVERDDSGEYTCTANNSVGFDSKTLNLAVDYLPTVRAKEKRLFGWAGEMRSFACFATGRPMPGISWYHDHHFLTSSTDSFIITSTKELDTVTSTLEIKLTKNNSQALFGVYSCLAKNAHGDVTDTVHLEEAFPPDMPRDVTVVGVTSSSFNLSVAIPSNTPSRPEVPPITHWTIEYRRADLPSDDSNTEALSFERPDDNGDDDENDENAEMMLAVAGLEADTSYTVHVYALNIVGRGTPSKIKIRTGPRPRLEEKTKEPALTDSEKIPPTPEPTLLTEQPILPLGALLPPPQDDDLINTQSDSGAPADVRQGSEVVGWGAEKGGKSGDGGKVIKREPMGGGEGRGVEPQDDESPLLERGMLADWRGTSVGVVAAVLMLMVVLIATIAGALVRTRRSGVTSRRCAGGTLDGAVGAHNRGMSGGGSALGSKDKIDVIRGSPHTRRALGGNGNTATVQLTDDGKDIDNLKLEINRPGGSEGVTPLPEEIYRSLGRSSKKTSRPTTPGGYSEGACLSPRPSRVLVSHGSAVQSPSLSLRAAAGSRCGQVVGGSAGGSGGTMGRNGVGGSSGGGGGTLGRNGGGGGTLGRNAGGGGTLGRSGGGTLGRSGGGGGTLGRGNDVQSEAWNAMIQQATRNDDDVGRSQQPGGQGQDVVLYPEGDPLATYLRETETDERYNSDEDEDDDEEEGEERRDRHFQTRADDDEDSITEEIQAQPFEGKSFLMFP